MRSAAPVGTISAAGPESLQREAVESCSFKEEKPEEEEDEESEDLMPNETKVNPKRQSDTDTPSANLESRIDAARGGGSSLDERARTFMESRFGYDFSGVRVHTSTSAAEMNRDIRSLAFTSGSDIFFGTGMYRPDTDSGRHLLAHELTHVVQQTGPRAGSGVVRETADPGVISRAQDPPERKWYYETLVSGTQVHHELEKILRGHDPAQDLVTEAAIPGANRNHARLNNIGVADLYKSTPATTVSGIKGIREVERDFDIIGMNSPGKTGTRPLAVTSSPKVTSTIPKDPNAPKDWRGDFPESVTIGEIKPASTSKLADGWAQLDNYTLGYQDFVKQVHKVNGGQTRASIAVHRLKLDMPEALNFDNWDAQHAKPYAAATFGTRRIWVAEVGAGNGVYLYEDLGASLKGKPTEWDKEYWPQLVKVRADLNVRHKRIKKLAQTKLVPGVTNPIQRKESDAAQWETKRQAFATRFRGQLKGKLKEYREKVRFEKKLGKSGRTLPQNQAREVKEYKSMMFWSGVGGKVLGKVRFMLGSAWDKAGDIFEKFKTKMSGVRTKIRGLSESSMAIGWAAKLIKVVVAASKIAASRFITESFNFFANCFQHAMDKVVERFQTELMESELGQKLCRARKSFDESKERLEKDWGVQIEKLEEMFKVISDVSEWTRIATTLINTIRLGVQIVSCLTPPALGCLWGLVVQVGLSAALGIVVGTQWFNDEIVTPQVRKLMRKYAAPSYQSLINRVLGEDLKDYHCNIADTEFPSMDFTANNGMREGSSELRLHRDAWEKENETEMMSDLQSVFGKSDGNPATKEDIKALVKQIQSKNLRKQHIEEMLDRARDTDSGKVDIEAVTQTAKERKAERKIDYPNAQRQNAYYAKKIGWEPKLFNQPESEASSEEFAEAVYDLQQRLGAYADGVAGPLTTIEFYKENKLAKDAIFNKAVEVGEQEQTARAEKKARAELKNELEALLKDEKIKAAMATKFPSDDQLKKDLASLRWENLHDGGIVFVQIGDRSLIAIKTQAGMRLGAYFHFVEREEKGVKRTMMLDTSQFYAMDKIPNNEVITFSIVDKEGRSGLWFMALKGQEKDTFSAPTLNFFSMFVEFE